MNVDLFHPAPRFAGRNGLADYNVRDWTGIRKPLAPEASYSLMCATVAGGNPLNHVDYAWLYAPMFSLYTRSPISRSGSSSDSPIVSSASHVGPNTAHSCVGPFLNAFTG